MLHREGLLEPREVVPEQEGRQPIAAAVGRREDVQELAPAPDRPIVNGRTPSTSASSPV
jgi:hypothetical protein